MGVFDFFKKGKRLDKNAGIVEDRTDPEVNLDDLDLSGNSTSDGPRESFVDTMIIHDGYSEQYITAEEASIIATDYNAMQEEMEEQEHAYELGRFLYEKCKDSKISLSAIPPELEKKWTQEYYASITAADDSRTDDDGRTDDDDVLLL